MSGCFSEPDFIAEHPEKVYECEFFAICKGHANNPLLNQATSFPA